MSAVLPLGPTITDGNQPPRPPGKLVRYNPAHVRPPNPDPRRGKRNPKYVQDLAKDILTYGLRHPPYVRMKGGGPMVIEGEHRRQALVLNGCTEAEFFLMDGEVSDAMAALVQWKEADQHEGFNPLEKAAAAETIMADEGLSRGELLERHGDDLKLNESSLSKVIRMQRICPLQRAAAEDGSLGFSVVYLVASLPDECALANAPPPTCVQREYAARYLSGEWKRDSLERKVKEYLCRAGAPKPAKPVVLKTGLGLWQVKPDATVEELLADVAAQVEKIKRCAKKTDLVESLPFLLKRGS